MGRPITLVLVFVLIWIFATTSCAETNETHEEKFRGPVFDVLFLKGSLGVCITSDAIYLSEGNLSKWKAIDLSTVGVDRVTATLRICGGSNECLYFLKYDDNRNSPDVGISLISYKEKAGPSVIRKVPQGPCSFFNDKLGCYASNSRLEITVDGGETWKMSEPVFKDTESATHIIWLSPQAIVVGGDQGTVAGISVSKNGGIGLSWHDVQINRIREMALGNDGIVWACGKKAIAYQAFDGKKLKVVKPKRQLEGMAATKKHLFLWGYTGIDIWELGDGDPKHIKAIEDPYIASVFPISDSVAAIITNGRILKWGEKEKGLVSVSLDLDISALKKQKTKGISPDELGEVMALAMKVPPDLRNKIFGEVNAIKELTPKQRAELLKERFRKALNQINTN